MAQFSRDFMFLTNLLIFILSTIQKTPCHSLFMSRHEIKSMNYITIHWQKTGNLQRFSNLNLFYSLVSGIKSILQTESRYTGTVNQTKWTCWFYGHSKLCILCILHMMWSMYGKQPIITYSDIIFQANAVIDLIGFPSYISNHTLLNQEYEDVRCSWILEKTMS